MKLSCRTIRAFFVFAVFLFFLAGICPAADTAPKNSNAAMVNGTAITSADIDLEAWKVQQYMSSRGQPVTAEQLQQLRGRILDDLIHRELLYQASREKGVSVDAAEVQTEIDQVKKNFDTPEAFAAALEDMEITEAQMTATMQRDMTIHRFVNEVVIASVTITEQEKKQFYDSHPEFFKIPERIRASHILIQVKEDAAAEDKAAARKKIENVKATLKDGQDFAESAKAYSEGPSAEKGGDLGYFARGQMVKPFEDAAFALDVGGTSEIVQTRFGYHIIRLTDRKPADTASYEDQAERIGQHLKQAKSEKVVQDYIEGLKAAAKIEKFIDK